MNADWRDAPDYFQTRRRKNGVASVIPWLIGTVITLIALHALSTAILGAAVENLSSTKPTTEPAPIAEIYRPQPMAKSAIDWDQVVNEQAQRDTTPQTQKHQATTETAKQTVFNDRNYSPQGAINIVPAEKVQARETPTKSSQKTEIVVVGKAEPRLSDYCPYKSGSIEHRNCKMRTNLNSR